MDVLSDNAKKYFAKDVFVNRLGFSIAGGQRMEWMEAPNSDLPHLPMGNWLTHQEKPIFGSFMELSGLIAFHVVGTQ